MKHVTLSWRSVTHNAPRPADAGSFNAVLVSAVTSVTCLSSPVSSRSREQHNPRATEEVA